MARTPLMREIQRAVADAAPESEWTTTRSGLLRRADGEDAFPTHGAVALTRADDGSWVEAWRIE